MDAKRQRLGATICLLSMLGQSLGCRTDNEFRFQNPPSNIPMFATALEEPSVPLDYAASAIDSGKPFTVTETEPRTPWPLTLREVIQLTLENSEVMRDLGIRVVGAPVAAVTVYDPAIQQVDPRSGVEAALSAFDAQFTTAAFWNRNERTFNNFFFGGGAAALSQNTSDFNAEVSKIGATGTQFALRNITNYDRNTAPNNRFHSVYLTSIQAEVRHPLLQGSGLDFNRIAGPGAVPGFYNGVLIARVNTDIALADFEIAVRDHLRLVEQTYWQLYFAYRNYAALLAGRDATLGSWRLVQARSLLGDAAPLEESAPREQYFQAQAAMQNALTGGGDGEFGVYQVERNLRMLMGIQINDDRLIQPADEPLMAQAFFEWDELVDVALNRRAELRRQAWAIQRRELELIAARSFQLMRLDIVGRYEWNGFGDDLFGQRDIENGSAFRDVFSGSLQNWQMGLQLTTPVGNRIGHAAVRSAELMLARERALHREQQRQIVAELSASFAELERAREVSRSNYNRAWASRERLRYSEIRYENGTGLIDDVLLAQQLVVVSDAAYARALVDHTLAASGIHYSRGTYLNYLGIELAEGPWSDAAYRSARKEAHRWGPRRLHNYCYMTPYSVSAGPVDQYPELPAPASGGTPVEALPPAPAADPAAGGVEPSGVLQPDYGAPPSLPPSPPAMIGD